MSRPMLPELSCPDCLSPLTRRAGTDEADCPACGLVVALTGRLCPACATYHAEAEPVCSHCSTPLRRTCPHCRQPNWSADTACRHCGATLDTLAVITARERRASDPFQTEKRAEIRAIKRQEELSASRRMADFHALEEERQTSLRARRQASARREQQILRAGLLLVGGTFLLLLLYALISALVG